MDHRKPIRRSAAGALASLVWACSVFGAVPPTQNFVSPEVHPDRTVTFRIKAPKATEVLIKGGWMKPDDATPLKKGSDDVWSVTVGPLEQTVYAYWYLLDGSVVLDEGNQYVRIRTGGSSVSMVDVHANDPSSPWAMRDVPHGSVEMNWVKSKIFPGETRKIWVYLPPGYEKAPSTRYPILYLFHGRGELYLAWTESGKANLIFDNLLAEKKMKPMIVVMPYTGPAETENGANSNQPPTPATQAQPANYVLDEVIPWAEAKYRVLPGRTHRAMAGLSAGGALTASIGFSHLDLFSQLGIFSSPTQSVSKTYPEFVKKPDDVNAKLSVLWMGVGDNDPLATAGMRVSDAELTKYGIKHVFKETAGAHEFSVWRWCLVQFAPLLFQK